RRPIATKAVATQVKVAQLRQAAGKGYLLDRAVVDVGVRQVQSSQASQPGAAGEDADTGGGQGEVGQGRAAEGDGRGAISQGGQAGLAQLAVAAQAQLFQPGQQRRAGQRLEGPVADLVEVQAETGQGGEEWPAAQRFQALADVVARQIEV